MLAISQNNRVCTAPPRIPIRAARSTSTFVQNTSILQPIRVVPKTSALKVRCAASSESSDDNPASSSFIDYALGQGAYQFLALYLFIVFSIDTFAAPLAAEKLLGMSLLPVSELILRATGSLILVPVAFFYRLQSAVAAKRLNSSTYKRLSVSCALCFAGALVAKYIAASKGVAFGSAFMWITNIVQILPTIVLLKLYGFSTLGEAIPGLISGISSLFQPDTFVSGVYSMLTVVAAFFGLSAVFFTKNVVGFMFAFPIDFFCEFVLRGFGLITLLIAVSLFTLKDGADRKRLGFSTFKTLNTAIALSSIAKFGTGWYVSQKAVNAAVTAGQEAVSLTTVKGGLTTVGFFLVLGLFCGYHAITAKKS